MYSCFQLFFIIAETPLHPGSGSELGVVDLPIQRERHTNFPKIEGSGLKGCIRKAFESLDKEIKVDSKSIKIKDYVPIIFGPEDGEEYAGSIAFTDARILLFPVKSLRSVFAWITCPMVLTRFIKDMEIVGKRNETGDWNLISVEWTVPKQSNIFVSNKIVLEEYSFEVKENEETDKIAKKLSEMIFPNDNVYSFWKEKLKKDLVILSDDEFNNFVMESTEIITGIKIKNETGTVQSGSLRTEEYVPQDTIFYSIAMTKPVAKEKASIIDKPEEVMYIFRNGLPKGIQIGGNQTIGKGIVRIKLWGDKDE